MIVKIEVFIVICSVLIPLLCFSIAIFYLVFDFVRYIINDTIEQMRKQNGKL